ncbi:MAG: ribosome recycling factor [Candidatus Margulisiibacteriota bacterium]
MQDVIKESEIKMQKALEALKKNLSGVRTGRANPSLLDHIKVSYYGSDVPLKQIAQVSAPEPRSLVITPFDKNASADIERALMSSDLGLNPRRDANVIRLSLPSPSEERRKELVKTVKKESEESKVALRNIRREAVEALKKKKNEKQITEDEEKTQDKKVQELTDKYSADIDKILHSKEKEILEV